MKNDPLNASNAEAEEQSEMELYPETNSAMDEAEEDGKEIGCATNANIQLILAIHLAAMARHTLPVSDCSYFIIVSFS
jgi:FMN phosphatase YigB (HAD superfamily)